MRKHYSVQPAAYNISRICSCTSGYVRKHMYCSHLSLSLLVVAGSRSHLLEISTHKNSIDLRKKQGGEGGGPPHKFYVSTHSSLSLAK